MRFNMLMTPSELELLTKLANARGCDRSTYVRMLITGFVDASKDAAKLVRSADL